MTVETFMKTQHLIPILFLAACCAVSALQGENGCKCLLKNLKLEISCPKPTMFNRKLSIIGRLQAMNTKATYIKWI